MSGAKVLVTGAADGLGRAVAERMAAHAGVEVVIGVTGAPSPAVAGIEVIGLSGEYDEVARLIRGRAIETIVHADRPWARSGAGRSEAGEHVIATMRLAAAAAHRRSAVRNVVMASSTRVYPVSSRAARLHPESEPLHPRNGSLAASLVEAESYMRDLATANPNLSVSILRLADMAGPGSNDLLPRLLTGPVVPAVWGFDPPVQLLHVDDAVGALVHAVDHDLAGVYNVAADDLVRWRRAARLAGKRLVELPFGPLVSPLLRWSYRLDAADDIYDVLCFGRAAGTDAFTRSGFGPAWSTAACLSGRGKTGF